MLRFLNAQWIESDTLVFSKNGAFMDAEPLSEWEGESKKNRQAQNIKEHNESEGHMYQ